MVYALALSSGSLYARDSKLAILEAMSIASVLYDMSKLAASDVTIISESNSVTFVVGRDERILPFLAPFTVCKQKFYKIYYSEMP